MPRPISPAWGASGGPENGFESVESLEVVGGADQRPFQRGFGQATEQETAEAQAGFDHAEDRFDGLLAQLVAGTAGSGGGAVGQPLEERRVLRWWCRIGARFELRDGAPVRFAFYGGEHRQPGRPAGGVGLEP